LACCGTAARASSISAITSAAVAASVLPFSRSVAHRTRQ
jgi:hypothetical protein